MSVKVGSSWFAAWGQWRIVLVVIVLRLLLHKKHRLMIHAFCHQTVTTS